MQGMLAALSRGSTDPLRSCGLDIDLDGKKYACALTISGNMRREHKSGGGAAPGSRRIDKRYRGTVYRSNAAEKDGSRRWIAMDASGTFEFERMRLLLGSILAWDALADPESNETTRRATWFRESKAPVIHREFDEKGMLQTLSVDGTRWRVTGWHEERGALLPELESKRSDGSVETLRYQRISLGSRFLPAYFAPEQHGEESKTPIVRRNADGNDEAIYDVALLEHSPERHFIEADCGDTWTERMKVILELGNKLGALGQRPNGLPAYLPGKVRVYFASSRAGEDPKAPEGYELKTRKAGNVVAIRHKAMPFRSALAKLGPRLEAFAKKRGYFSDGPLLILPVELPREDPSQGPSEGDPVEVRVEMRIR